MSFGVNAEPCSWGQQNNSDSCIPVYSPLFEYHLTHCGSVTGYVVSYLGQHCPRHSSKIFQLAEKSYYKQYVLFIIHGNAWQRPFVP